MQSLTSRSNTRRRLMRLAGTGATALLAATAIASTAGAAAPANTRGHRQRGLPQRIEHGGAERHLGADHGELDDDHGFLQDGDRGSELRDQR